MSPAVILGAVARCACTAIMAMAAMGWLSAAQACTNDQGKGQRLDFSGAPSSISIHNDLATGSVIASGDTEQRVLWTLKNCEGRQLSRTLTYSTYANHPDTYRIPGVNGIGYRIYGPVGPPAKPLPRPIQTIQAAGTTSGPTRWRMELVKIGAFNSTSVTIPSGQYASMDLSGFGNIAGFFLPRNITIVSAAKPCSISSSNNLVIDLGRIGANSLQAKGAAGPWKDGQAKIAVTSCPAGTQRLMVRFSGEADPSDGSLFKNVGGTASQVAIRFAHQGVGVIAPGGTSSVSIKDGRAEMPLTAQFMATGAASAGTVAGRVTATVTYQ